MNKIYLILACLLISVVIGLSVLNADNQALKADYDNLGPSEIHEYLGKIKAERLESSRYFAERAAKYLPSQYPQTDYDVIFYDIKLDIDDVVESIAGSVTMRAEAVVSGITAVEIDIFENLTVDSVYGPSGNYIYSRAGDRMTVELDKNYDSGEIFEITTVYTGQPTGTGFMGMSFRNNIYGDPVISTLSEPYSARSWWPCKDRPDDKADSIDIEVTCRDIFFCASNGNLIDSINNGDGTKTFWYEVRYPITTYLFSLAIADYTIWEDWYHYGTDDSMVIINHVYPEFYQTSLPAYGVTPDAISIFADLFGEYPFIEEKYGHANFEWGGAMEHQTVSSMSGSSFGFNINVIVHELAHQWWGDMITCNNWHEIWLNEGFASYSEALYYENALGTQEYHDHMNDMFYDGGGAVYIYDTTSVGNIFSLRVYDKGAWLLHMLRHIVGDSTFFDCLQAYYSSAYQYGDATTEQFKNICESVSGTELDYFFEDWIYGTFLPRYYNSYYVEPNLGEGNYYLFYNIRQAHPTTPPVFRMPLDIVIYHSAGVDTLVVFNDERSETFILEAPVIPDSVLFDPNDWVLKYDYEESWTLQLIPFALDSGQTDSAYLDSVVAFGSGNPITFSLIDGSLPPGLELDSQTGHISGTPSLGGHFTFEIEADDNTYKDTLQYEISIETTPSMVAGDVENNGEVNLLDVTYLIAYLYRGGPAPPIPNQADADADCDINLLDMTYIINYLYKDGPDPLMGCVQ